MIPNPAGCDLKTENGRWMDLTNPRLWEGFVEANGAQFKPGLYPMTYRMANLMGGRKEGCAKLNRQFEEAESNWFPLRRTSHAVKRPAILKTGRINRKL